MTSSLVRGRQVICGIGADDVPVVVDDGAVYQRDGTILEIAPFADLKDKYAVDEIIGSGSDIVLPGLVNSHHHLGITPFQHGVPDLPLELWLAARIGMRDVDPYLDTLYSAFELVASGVTTVQHLHGRVAPPVERMHASATAVISAYEAIGMRASYSYGIRDQNRLVYGDDAAFAATLPDDARRAFQSWLATQSASVDDCLALFEQLHAEYSGFDRIRVQLAPLNLQWCTDETLVRVKDEADRYAVPLHMHLLETGYQRQYAHQRTGGCGAVLHLHKLGLLGPNLTLGHGAWLTPADIDLLATSRTCVCHNPSSNMRLQSGLAPVEALLAAGVPVALGIDEAGINDDRDMLQEMRLAMTLHRRPGHSPSGVTAAEALRMATEYGARTTSFADRIGRLEPGRAADIILVPQQSFAWPFLDASIPLIDAVLRRTRAGGVKLVMVGGEVIMRDGVFTRLDRQAVLEELAAALGASRSGPERDRLLTSELLMPHVRDFYVGYWDRH